MRKSIIPVAILTLGLVACGAPEAEDAAVDEALPGEEIATDAAPESVAATLATADGEPAGIVTATADGESVLLSLTVENLPAGTHGVHVHTTGVCEGPTFESAGAHWNPTGQSHGLESPDGQHAGDMPNLEVGEDGTGTLEYTLGGGATFAGLTDADGSAFLVHALEDDQTTDPSGASGDRIACGVFETTAADAGTSAGAGPAM